MNGYDAVCIYLKLAQREHPLDLPSRVAWMQEQANAKDEGSAAKLAWTEAIRLTRNGIGSVS